MADKQPKELRINFPKPFNGERNDTTRFLQDVELYLGLNKTIYDDATKMVCFVLSFMNEGTAGTWKEGFIADKTGATGTFAPGTWNDFKALIKTAFSPTDVGGNARAKLRDLKQSGSADEYVAEFRILAQRSGIKDNTALIEYFMEGLKPKLLEKIYTLDTMPTKLADWYTYTTRFDNQWNRVKEIIARNRGGTTPTKKTTGNAPRYVNTHDPNAMDIDRMTIEEQNEHMKKGLCFRCHRPGHRGIECPEKKNTNTTPNQNRFQGFKKTGKTAYAMIRSLYNKLNEEDQAICMQKMESEGF